MFCLFLENQYDCMWRSLEVARTAAKALAKQTGCAVTIYRSLKGADPRNCHDPRMQFVATVSPSKKV